MTLKKSYISSCCITCYLLVVLSVLLVVLSAVEFPYSLYYTKYLTISLRKWAVFTNLIPHLFGFLPHQIQFKGFVFIVGMLCRIEYNMRFSEWVIWAD